MPTIEEILETLNSQQESTPLTQPPSMPARSGFDLSKILPFFAFSSAVNKYSPMPGGNRLTDALNEAMQVFGGLQKQKEVEDINRYKLGVEDWYHRGLVENTKQKN